jgi:hypothetical protein
MSKSVIFSSTAIADKLSHLPGVLLIHREAGMLSLVAVPVYLHQSLP